MSTSLSPTPPPPAHCFVRPVLAVIVLCVFDTFPHYATMKSSSKGVNKKRDAFSRTGRPVVLTDTERRKFQAFSLLHQSHERARLTQLRIFSPSSPQSRTSMPDSTTARPIHAGIAGLPHSRPFTLVSPRNAYQLPARAPSYIV